MRRNRQEKNFGIKLLGDITAMILIGMVITLIITGTETSFRISKSERINITPIRVQDIREIGQWEFLSVADEELVDTLHEHWWRDKELIRIYRGTLRLGIDLGKAKEQWIHLQGDTAIVELPGIELLDDDFIDEANSEAFFETGSWDQDAREALYQKAKRQMYERCYTRENILQAEENAKEQLAQFVKAMGFEHAVVKLEK
ncbi:MAG: DUF4230 domain-containing protein [Prevotella sp.]|nr:DUF4230 domain-containing protein [Prevotella sp.]